MSDRNTSLKTVPITMLVPSGLAQLDNQLAVLVSRLTQLDDERSLYGTEFLTENFIPRNLHKSKESCNIPARERAVRRSLSRVLTGVVPRALEGLVLKHGRELLFNEPLQPTLE